MSIAIRGTTPATVETVSNPVSLTLTGARQPQAGDVLIIIHFNDFYDLANMATPTVGGSTSGVTAITNGTYDRGSSQTHGKSYYFVVPSTGDLTVSATETGSADEEKGLAVYVLSGVDTANPIDTAANATSITDDTSPDAPSVSPATSDAFLICHISEFGDAGTYSPPGGMTEQYDDGGSLSFTGATEQLAASGATGLKTFASTNSQGFGSVSIAVRTASAAAAPAGGGLFRGPLPGRINPDRRVYLPGRFRLPDSAPPVGTLFTADLAGSITPAGTLVNQVAKGLGGTITPAGALVKLVSKLLAGTVTPTGALVKQTQKPLGGTVTPAGVLALTKVILRSFAGTVTPVGTLLKQTNKPLAGTVIPAGSLVKQDQKPLGGTTTPAGSIRKFATKPLGGTITPAGSLATIKLVVRAFAGTITPTGALTKQTQKSLGGATTPTGSIRRNVSISRGGTITPTGELRKIISKFFSGVIAAVGSLLTEIPSGIPLQLKLGDLRRRFGITVMGRRFGTRSFTRRHGTRNMERRYDVGDMERRYGTGDMTREP